MDDVSVADRSLLNARYAGLSLAVTRFGSVLSGEMVIGSREVEGRYHVTMTFRGPTALTSSH